jgi:hypothetical protein
MKKNNQDKKRGGSLVFLSSKWHWHNPTREHQFVCENIQIPRLPKGGIDQWGVDCNMSFLGFELH